MLCSRDFCNRNKYNNETNEQLWMSILSDSHELVCNCNFPFAHLLALIFPLGHTDRNLTINQILLRDYKEKCHSGGAGDASSGMAGAAGPEPKEDTERNTAGQEEDADLAALLAAVEEDDKR